MSKLGDALGFGGGGAAEESLPPIPEDIEALDAKAEPAESGGDAEVLAMQMFERAKTPEAKVDALKAFGEACGWGGGDY